MIAHAALVMKDIFAARFTSIQLILDSMVFFMNTRYFWLNLQDLASICYLSVNSFLLFIFYKVGHIFLCMKCH